MHVMGISFVTFLIYIYVCDITFIWEAMQHTHFRKIKIYRNKVCIANITALFWGLCSLTSRAGVHGFENIFDFSISHAYYASFLRLFILYRTIMYYLS